MTETCAIFMGSWMPDVLVYCLLADGQQSMASCMYILRSTLVPRLSFTRAIQMLNETNLHNTKRVASTKSSSCFWHHCAHRLEQRCIRLTANNSRFTTTCERHVLVHCDIYTRYILTPLKCYRSIERLCSFHSAEIICESAL